MFFQDCELMGEKGRYQGKIHPRWEIWGPNGGYLSAIALNAVAKEASYSRPISYFCHYLGVGKFADIQVLVDTIKAGRSTGVYQVEIRQEDKLILRAQVIAGNDTAGYEHQHPQVPYKTLPEQLESITNETGHAFWKNFDLKAADPRMFSQEHSGEALHEAWYHFNDAQASNAYQDAMRSLVLIDTMQWPANYMYYGGDQLPYLAPSLDLYVQFNRFSPEEKWLFCRSTCDHADQGYLGGQAEVWDTDGKLLACGGSQLMCVPRSRFE